MASNHDENRIDGSFPRQRARAKDDIFAVPGAQKQARDDDDNDDDDYDRPTKRRLRRSSGGNAFVDFLLFKKFVGPWIILVLYWIFVVIAVFGGIAMIIISIIAVRQAGAVALLGVLYGLLIMIVYPIAVRVSCELMVVMFRIHDTLIEIRDRL